MGRRPPAQPRTFTAGQHGGEVPRLDARRSVADAVHAPVLAEQHTGIDAVANLVRRQAGR
jgi:hypothetical protein